MASPLAAEQVSSLRKLRRRPTIDRDNSTTALAARRRRHTLRLPAHRPIRPCARVATALRNRTEGSAHAYGDRAIVYRNRRTGYPGHSNARYILRRRSAGGRCEGIRAGQVLPGHRAHDLRIRRQEQDTGRRRDCTILPWQSPTQPGPLRSCPIRSEGRALAERAFRNQPGRCKASASRHPESRRNRPGSRSRRARTARRSHAATNSHQTAAGSVVDNASAPAQHTPASDGENVGSSGRDSCQSRTPSRGTNHTRSYSGTRSGSRRCVQTGNQRFAAHTRAGNAEAGSDRHPLVESHCPRRPNRHGRHSKERTAASRSEDSRTCASCRFPSRSGKARRDGTKADGRGTDTCYDVLSSEAVS